LFKPQASSGKPPGSPNSARNLGTPGADLRAASSLATFKWLTTKVGEQLRLSGGTENLDYAAKMEAAANSELDILFAFESAINSNSQ
jgi:hypothetical protein